MKYLRDCGVEEVPVCVLGVFFNRFTDVGLGVLSSEQFLALDCTVVLPDRLVGIIQRFEIIFRLHLQVLGHINMYVTIRINVTELPRLHGMVIRHRGVYYMDIN